MSKEEQIVFISTKVYKRLDLAISAETEYSRNKIKKIIEQGLVLVNNVICKIPSKKVLENDEISISPLCDNVELEAQDQYLEVLYQDNDIAVINKKAGITVHPCPSCKEITLISGLLYLFPQLQEMGGERPGIVHRLDKDTSGLMLIALHENVRLLLAEAFSGRKIHKTYLALVRGFCLDGENFSPIGRHPTLKTKMAIVPISQGGRDASTTWKRIFALNENFDSKVKNKMQEIQKNEQNVSLMSVKIATGRTHQIRVHLSSIGHGLLGDGIYADGKTAKLAPRQMLHAHKLEFSHPISGQEMSFSSPPPQDFYQCMKNFGAEKLFFQKIIITGKSGSGKSTVLKILKEKGFATFSADSCVLELYQPNQDAWILLKNRFGERFLIDEKEIDKKALFLAMHNPTMRKEIENIIHPLVYAKMQEFFEEQESKYLQMYQNEIMPNFHVNSYPFVFVVAEIPLWHESKQNHDQQSGIDDYKVICVCCDEENRVERLKHRGWSDETIAQMDSWQYSQNDKAKKSNYVLDNSKNLEQLELNLAKLLEQIENEQNQKLELLMAKFSEAIQNN